MLVEIDNNNFNDILSNNKKVLVDFNATWCGPCRMLKPIIHEFSSTSKIKVCSCDVDKNEDLAFQFGISSIPCLILFENGKEIKRNVGFVTMEELKDFVGE